MATSRNRVLRGVRATGAAKRTQGAHRPRESAPRVGRSGSRRRHNSGRQHRSAENGRAQRFHRGPGAGHVRNGDVQEPGRPRRLRVENPGGQPGEQALAPTSWLHSSWERSRSRARYRGVKETKRSGKGGGDSEHCIVPGKRGNSPGGPRGGKAVPDCGTDWGERWTRHRAREPSQRDFKR